LPAGFGAGLAGRGATEAVRGATDVVRGWKFFGPPLPVPALLKFALLTFVLVMFVFGAL